MPDTIFDSLEPNLVWRRFCELKNTPRPSKHEQQAVDYLRTWAGRLGFEMQSDEVGNLCIQVPATPGCEDSPAVVLQNHVDIVAANAENASGDSDAARAMIPVERGDFDDAGRFTPNSDGDWIHAPLTTLGADNGIGCASAMAISETEGLRHPPLELLFTVDEEDGMSGALELDPDALNMRGRILINLDTEDDDELTIGSAGGCNVHIRWESAQEEVTGWTTRELVLKDLRGGHSGTEINSGRANAIRLMACALDHASRRFPLRIVAMEGGDRRNAIPRSCSATVVIEEANRDALQDSLAKTCSLLNEQFAGRDNSVAIAVVDGGPAGAACSVQDSQQLVDLLLGIPTGVFEMTPEIPDLPETSGNMALISTVDQTVQIDCSLRSSYEAGMRDILATIHAAARLAGANVEKGNNYPGWKPNLNSQILQATRNVYQRLFKEDPKVLAVHAGLECGVLTSRIPGLDCISFGPTIRGNHAPGEHVCVSSVEKSYRLLIELLSELA